MAISMLSMWDITFNQIKKKAPESTGIPLNSPKLALYIKSSYQPL